MGVRLEEEIGEKEAQKAQACDDMQWNTQIRLLYLLTQPTLLFGSTRARARLPLPQSALFCNLLFQLCDLLLSRGELFLQFACACGNCVCCTPCCRLDGCCST